MWYVLQFILHKIQDVTDVAQKFRTYGCANPDCDKAKVMLEAGKFDVDPLPKRFFQTI